MAFSFCLRATIESMAFSMRPEPIILPAAFLLVMLIK